MADATLGQRYPDEATRRGVCTAILARVEVHDVLRGRKAMDASLEGKVTEGPDFWIVHDCVAAKEGVNDKGEFKPWPELVASADSLSGVPLLYGLHPRDSAGVPDIHFDPRRGVGHAVNVRANDADHTLRYDALLFKRVPDGYYTDPADVAKNAVAVQLIRAGGTIENSVGYTVTPEAAAGTFNGAQYREIQHDIEYGHIALLKPVGAPVGGSCGPACALGVDSSRGDSCGDGAHCCKTRMAAAVQAIMDSTGCSESAALALIVAAPHQT